MYDRHAVMSRYGRTPDEDAHALNYLKMLKIVMSRDGELRDAEAFETFLHGLGIAAELVAQVDAFATAGVTPKHVVPAMRDDGQLARLLIRDAIELMSQDGVYTFKERHAIAQLGHQLGVRLPTVRALETLVELERSAARLHQALLSAD